jgi:hypothetical protein
LTVGDESDVLVVSSDNVVRVEFFNGVIEETTVVIAVDGDFVAERWEEKVQVV